MEKTTKVAMLDLDKCGMAELRKFFQDRETVNPGTMYEIIYQRNPVFDSEPFDLENLDITHAYLFDITANNMEEVFERMQGHNWSPFGEARSLIMRLDLRHTSMSVGDVIREKDTGRTFVVDSVGFKQLT